jgi:hypothetical protein
MGAGERTPRSSPFEAAMGAAEQHTNTRASSTATEERTEEKNTNGTDQSHRSACCEDHAVRYGPRGSPMCNDC